MVDIKYMQAALEEAKKAYEKDEVPVGAVIVANDTIIARAHNIKESTKNATSHAEMLCIEEASKKLDKWRLDDCTLYVTLFPCPMCLGAINESRIKKVYYGTNIKEDSEQDNLINAINEMTINPNVSIEGGLLSNECSMLLKDFFTNKRNRI